ncbi:MAG TPA: LLM class flavin-dependent oxidoreductase [Methylomirabilota bacterium]|nr:LLM class flavin-dependent oxidoreductase [Methylomirabilota bacterium]
MITKFSVLYVGQIELDNIGKNGTPADERRYPNERFAEVYFTARDIARTMDDLGFYCLWTAEHHFQREGYEVVPNLILFSTWLATQTRRLKFGCAFNILPMWHPIRLAEDYAMADIMTDGRVIFGVGRGYHTREVETFGAPMLDADANRALFEEQVEIIMKAFHSESFAHRGRHYTLPPAVPYRGYELKEITLVPRPLRQPVECWQPIVSAGARGLDFMIKHRIKGLIGGGAATMAERSIHAYREAAERAGLDWALGENLSLGIFYHLADSRERAVREITPWYEEHVKMFGPLGFVPGITPAQLEASTRRGGWAAAGVPTVEDYMKVGAWFAGPPEALVAHLRSLEERFPGLQHVHLSNSMGTPRDVMLEQLAWLGKEVVPRVVAR